MTARSSTFRLLRLARSAAKALRWISTKSALSAPRESASRPRAPEPANRSSTRASEIQRCRMLNHASRTRAPVGRTVLPAAQDRSEEHTSELQSLAYLVCRLLLEKKKKNTVRLLPGSRRLSHL